MPTVLIFLAFTLIVLQQPYGQPAYIASVEGSVTQFSMASEVGNVGLLAHNYMAGGSFFEIQLGDRLELVLNDGRRQIFLVKEIRGYQALSPLSQYSLFVDLETQEVLTAEELFGVVYRGEKRLTLQTCIEKNGNINWGRLFVIATMIQRMPTQTIE